jgi:hypothetical protein
VTKSYVNWHDCVTATRLFRDDSRRNLGVCRIPPHSR